MVYITEDRPERLVGISSLFVYADHPDAEIGQFIASSGTYQYNDRTGEY